MRLFSHKPYMTNSAMGSADVIPIKVIIILFTLLILAAISNAGDDSDALLALKGSLHNAGVLRSWKAGSDPCNEDTPWEGIHCIDGAVQGIRLEGLNLSGIFDINALSQIPFLRTVSFIANSFSGPLPPFNKLVPLRALHLSNNMFTGEIPGDYFTEMKYLKKLHLSYNQFSGPIPPSLNVIPLIELFLDNNQFSGSIPELNQEPIEMLNLSNNNLTGPIPPGLSRFDEKTFQGNPGLCGPKVGKPCDEEPSPPPPPQYKPPPQGNEDHQDDGTDNHTEISLWIMLACGVILVIMILGIIFLRRRQMKNPELNKANQTIFDESGRSMTVFDEVNAMTEPQINASGRTVTEEPNDTCILVRGNSKRPSQGGSWSGVGDLTMVNNEKGEFRLSDLMKSAAEVLGNGIVGSSYKAIMSNGFTVVVKRIKEMDKLEKAVFDAEIRRLASIKHKNVLAPLAYHYREEEKLLITEYMPKGSLLYILHGDRGSPYTELKWPVRSKIIQGIARGLFYIHTELSQNELPHGNLKSCNVLLSPEYDPLLSDYGFSSLLTSTQATHTLFAYKSPEALQNQPVSPRCDVYSMGIIILELLTGKFPSQYLNSSRGGTDVVQWARSAISEGREVDILDPEIGSSVNSLPKMRELLHIGAACTEPDPGKRLDIKEASRRIELLHSIGSSSQQLHHINSISGPGGSKRHNSEESTLFEISIDER